MIGLDTNVLARALAADDETQSQVAQQLLLELTEEQPGFVNLTVMLELYWVLRNAIRLEPTRVHAIVEQMMRTPSLEIEDGEAVGEALGQAVRGADFADALIDATNQLYGIADTVTFDTDAARRFGWRLLA